MFKKNKHKFKYEIEKFDRAADKMDFWVFFLIMVGLYGGICLALWYMTAMAPKASLKPKSSPTEETIGKPSSYIFPPPDTLPYVTNSKHFYAETTEYTKIETCPKTSCHTASGSVPNKDREVACPRKIALQTVVEIDGKKYTCTDRTSRNYDGRFDIYHGSTQTDYQEALQYGIQEKEITIL